MEYGFIEKKVKVPINLGEGLELLPCGPELIRVGDIPITSGGDSTGPVEQGAMLVGVPVEEAVRRWGYAGILRRKTPAPPASTFAESVARELARAREKHAQFPTLHHGLAVLLEELEELKAEVFMQNPNTPAMLTECRQIGAMAQRFAEDLLNPKP